jgi:hypothetical protein
MVATGIEAAPFVLLGVPVCAAVVVACVMITVDSLLANDPVTRRSELWQVWTVGGFAAIALFVSHGAWQRVRHTKGGGLSAWMARTVPYLFVIGGIGGALFALKMLGDERRDLAASDENLCTSVLSRQTAAEPSPSALEACKPAAARCRREQALLDIRSDTKRVIPDFDYRPDVICLRKAGTESGWLPPPAPPPPPFELELKLPQ